VPSATNPTRVLLFSWAVRNGGWRSGSSTWRSSSGTLKPWSKASESPLTIRTSWSTSTTLEVISGPVPVSSPPPLLAFSQFRYSLPTGSACATAGGYSRGVHRWTVSIKPSSVYPAVGVFPKQFTDWTSSYMGT
jgi:hypothetical protein